MDNLLNLPVGETARVIAVQGGMGMQRHLANLGIIPGKKVRKIIAQPIGGPMILEVEGGRIAIGRKMAQRIKIIKELK